MKSSKVHSSCEISGSVRTVSVATLASLTKDAEQDVKKPSTGSLASKFASFWRNNNLTNTGKRMQMLKMLSLTIIPTVALVVMCIIDVTNVSAQTIAGKEIHDMVRLSTEVGKLIHYLQRERGYSSLHVVSDGQAKILTRALLSGSYKRTSEVLDTMSKWPGETNTPFEKFPTKMALAKYLADHRITVDNDGSAISGMRRELRFYSGVVTEFINWLYSSIQFSNSGNDWRKLVAYQLLLTSKNDMGIERTLGSIFYIKGHFEEFQDFEWYFSERSMGKGNFIASTLFSPEVADMLQTRLKTDKQNVTYHIEQMRQQISLNNHSFIQGSLQMSFWWFQNMSNYLDILFDVQLSLADIIVNSINEDLASDTKSISISVSILCLVVVICPVIILSVRTLVSDIQKYAFSLADQTKQLSKERQRTESLLYQMLPRPVADQLKSNKSVDAETYEEVTIFFSDIVGFTSISAACSPMEVVGLLNTLYLCFDTRLELYDVYKVETIGDAYMVASGVPNRNGRRHVSEVATMSLDLAHHVTHLEIPHLPDTLLRLRAGVHTGPVVAGVVGSKMPRYCLFGDSVNTASRMESTGQADRIQLSWITQAILQQIGGFRTIKRGVVEVKGKGHMETYWLLNKDGFEDSLVCMPDCHKLSTAEYRRISEIKA
ncbi:uncharacterized protein LOC126827125 [Patella vulgata]|uniref:uncharacterized protein LOC126827125 n=1 Tax=Patella vulgata TaxID=6465 RepID=UPI0024A9FD8C|nr:uncharacterized protein LOC126827125 [Patella vulgata]